MHQVMERQEDMQKELEGLRALLDASEQRQNVC
jgi:hypothetical protein